MDPQEIRLLVEAAKRMKNFWWYISIFLLINIISAPLGGYLTTKGQNFATKSDIEVLTRKVEEIKFEYTKRGETLKGSNDIKNPKRKELYERIENFRSFLLTEKNDPTYVGSISVKTQELLVYLTSNSAFKDMEPERDILMKEYNSWVYMAEHSIGRKIVINTDITYKALEKIQSKLIE